MSEPTILCPNCKTEIKLTESLAAPLIEATRQQYEERISKQATAIANREAQLLEKQREVADALGKIDAQVAEKLALSLKSETEKITKEQVLKATQAAALILEEKGREVEAFKDVLRINNEKLAEAQKAQVDFIKKERALDEAKRELDLTVQKQIQEGLGQARDTAKKEAEDSLKFKVMEKDQVIASMQKKIEELKQKSEQGSQQLQGEVQELELEGLLRAKFPFDSIEPVPKGEFGGDAIQRVVNPLGQSCGTILWESKRTRNWSDGWLSKLREDQRGAKAEIAVIVTQALPKGVETFDVVDGIWVVSPSLAIPVATALRDTLLQVGMARAASEGQKTKTEMVYQYLTGPRFKLRVEAIVEAFSSMQEDLNKEKKMIMKQWAKREEQIGRVMGSTIGMYGDLQGIAGKSLQEIEGLELPALDFDSDFA